MFRRIRKSYEYTISPLTVYELIAGLSGTSEGQFDGKKDAIRFLYPTGGKEVLSLLRAFIPKQLFNEERQLPPSVDTDFPLWLKAVLQAKTKASLQSGRLKVGSKRIGLDLANINKQMRDVENGFAGLFTRLRAQKVPELTPNVWAEITLTAMRIPINPNNLQITIDGLDAAYRFAAGLWAFIKNPRYDFHKHRAELVDAQQLYYLCDPTIWFVTNEARRIRNKLSSSPQSNRIITFDELRAQLH